MADPKRFSFVDHPSQLQESQNNYLLASPLSHSWSIPTQSTNNHTDHSGPHLRQSATVGHAVQQQALVQHYTAPTSTECLSPGKLYMTVYKARDIRGFGLGEKGKADPYAEIILGGRNFGGKAKTSAHQNAGSDPVWNEVFVFVVKTKDLEYNKLSITLLNKNTWRKDNVLGELEIINLGQYIREKLRNKENRETWYPVFRKGKQEGEILMNFDFVPMSHEEILRSELTVITGSVPPLRSDPNKEYKIFRLSQLSKLVQVTLQGAIMVVPLILV